MRTASPFHRRLLPFFLTVVIFSCIMMSPISLIAKSQAHEGSKPQRTLTLSAIGTIESKPDMATINTGIETEAVRARDALDDNNDTMARMMKSLRERGLEERDIATTQFTIQPRYQHFKTGRRSPKIIGYRVKNSLSITVRNLDELGGILDRLVTLGSNRMNGISFGLSDPDKALEQARKEAMQRVLAKAKLYAEAANVTLGPIKSISERTNRFTPRQMSFSAKRSRRSVPIAPGQHKTNVTVNVQWQLGAE